MSAVVLFPADAHNRLLLEQAYPPDWQNPAPAARYDLVVIGGGTGGLVSALGAAGLGARVALVERALLGGDCLNFGCVPSKGMLSAARVAATVRGAGAFGVRAGGPVEVDFARVMERMRGLRAGIARNDSAARLRQHGVDVFLGEASFRDLSAIEVAGETLRFVRAIVATGGRAAVPDLPGLREAPFLTNETIFSLTERPQRLTVIGGGPIGCELSQAFARLGAQVTLINRGPQLLPREDADAAAVIERRLRAEGVRVELGATIAQVAPDRTAVLAGAQGEQRIAADALLLATGRAPNLEGLALERAGIESNARGILVDDHLRTTNSRVFAVGDVAARWQFTHAADAMARLALQNALFFGRKKASALVMPWCTYTDPEVAHVGLSMREALERWPSVRTLTVPLSEVDRAVLDGETEGFARLHVGARGRLLGATLVSAHAGESLGALTLAMGQGLTVSALAATIHPYPTQAEAFKRAADAWNRERLTDRVRRLLQLVLRVQR